MRTFEPTYADQVPSSAAGHLYADLGLPISISGLLGVSVTRSAPISLKFCLGALLGD